MRRYLKSKTLMMVEKSIQIRSKKEARAKYMRRVSKVIETQKSSLSMSIRMRWKSCRGQRLSLSWCRYSTDLTSKRQQSLSRQQTIRQCQCQLTMLHHLMCLRSKTMENSKLTWVNHNTSKAETESWMVRIKRLVIANQSHRRKQKEARVTLWMERKISYQDSLRSKGNFKLRWRYLTSKWMSSDQI